MRHHGDCTGKTEIHLATHQGDGRRAGAFIGDVRCLKARALLKHFEHQMVGRARATRCGIHLAILLFCQRDEILQRRCGQAGMRNQELSVR